LKAAGTAFILPSVKWLADLGILFYGIVCRQPQARAGSSSSSKPRLIVATSA
jgi:hypothetical protein